MYYKNGDRYEGGFKEDVKHGQAIHYFANGDRIIGDFYYNKEVGTHVLLEPNGNVSKKTYS